MRQVTATEKYRAVNENKMAKGEFVRQMRMAYPSVISQYNGYDDTVQILKNKGYISEKVGTDASVGLNISLESIDRGVRHELTAKGIDPTEALAHRDEELLAKIEATVVKNLKKNPLHYIHLISGESAHVDKNDKCKETQRGKEDVDTYNAMKKATLKESIVDEAGRQMVKENLAAIIGNLKAKYGDIPGINSVLKDFVLLHGKDILAGADPETEFENYIDANFDALEESEVDEYRAQTVDSKEKHGKPVSTGKVSASDVKSKFGLKEPQAKKANMKMIDGIPHKLKDGKWVALKRVAESDLQEGRRKKTQGGKMVQEADYDTGGYVEAMGPVFNKAVDLLSRAFGEWKDGPLTEPGMINPAKNDVVKYIDTRLEKDHLLGEEKADKDYDKDGEIESGEAEYFGSKDQAIKNAMGHEEQLREAVKSIIKRVLTEDTVNEAATAQLAKFGETYDGYEGLSSAVNALENIVTDVESYYSKMREKIQKIYDDLNNIKNEEGLNVGPFLAPSIESAFLKDLAPVLKKGFNKGLELPKVRTISQADIDMHNSGERPLGEEEKQTVFTPLAESKKK